MSRLLSGSGHVGRAWSTLHREGVSAVLQKATRYLRRERDMDRQAPCDAHRAMEKMAGSEVGRGLFIDCGSNIGQGFSYFERRFPLKHFDFILIEPNPFCCDKLRSLIARRGGNIELIQA